MEFDRYDLAVIASAIITGDVIKANTQTPMSVRMINLTFSDIADNVIKWIDKAMEEGGD